ncbi:MAG: hypothetical protein KAT05_13640 [Spirochaetes bacterium]|nr:hypothetical protein [Spirochaetota bacterium]
MFRHLFIIFLIIILFSCKTKTDPIIYDKKTEVIDKEVQLIQILINNNNHKEAVKQIEKNLNLYPDNQDIMHLKGWLLLKQNKFDESEEIFLSLLNENKKNPLVLAGLARINRIIGNKKKAKEYIKIGLSYIKSLSILWLEKGILEYEENEYKKALIDFNKAYNLNNKNYDAYFFKYITMLQLGRELDEIKQYWENILNNKSAKSWYFLYHADILYKKDNKELAFDVVKNGLSNYPDDPYLLNMSSIYLYEYFITNKEEKIIEEAKEKILRSIKNTKKLEPEFIDTYLSILEITGQQEKLKEEINKYFLFFPNSQIIIDWVKKNE